MGLKGLIQPDHIPVNKFKLKPVGLVDIVFITMSGLEKELEMADMPDRTRESGGNTKAGTFTATTAEHHEAEMTALNLWFLANQDPVQPLAKIPCTLEKFSISGNIVTTIALTGVQIEKRAGADLDMANEGELAVVEWTFSFDDWDYI
jgi:hypothetical protein